MTRRQRRSVEKYREWFGRQTAVTRLKVDIFVRLEHD